MQNLSAIHTAAGLVVDQFVSDHASTNPYNKFISAAILSGSAGARGKLELIKAAQARMVNAQQAQALAIECNAHAEAATIAGEFDSAARYLKQAKEAAQLVQDFHDAEGAEVARDLCAVIQAMADHAKATDAESQGRQAIQAVFHFRREIEAVTGMRIKGDKQGTYSVIEPAHVTRIIGKKAARAKRQGAQAPIAADMPRADTSAVSIEVIGQALGDTSIDAMLRSAILKCGNVNEFDAACIAAKAWFKSRNAATVVDIKKAG